MKKLSRYVTNPVWVIPIALFFLAKFFAFFIAYFFCNDDPSIGCWMRWDSALYLQIAERGHDLFHCTPGLGDVDKWCGNAGWAPLYPWLIRLVSYSGISPLWAGYLLSAFFFLLYLLFVGKIAQINSFKIENWMVVALAAFCPGNIYFHAVFPLSLAACCMAVLIYQLQKEKYLYAGIAGYFGVMSYGIGFFLLAAAGIFSVILFFKDRKKMLPFTAQTLGLSLAGLLTIFGYDQWKTGHWNAMFLIQEKYGHSLNSPLKMLGIHLQMLQESKGMMVWVEIQNLVVLAMVLFMAFWMIRSKSLGPIRFFYALYLFFFWFLPYSASSHVALYRNAAMLGPGYAAPAKLPLWLLAIILAVFILLSIPMGQLFIQGAIV